MKRIIVLGFVILLTLALLTGCNDIEKDDLDNESIKDSIISEFINIADVPRESTQAKAISTYLRTWAKENGFKVARDKAYNIIIEKDATQGYENVPTTILHSNMDMISVAEEGIEYDPFNDTINIEMDGKNLFAEGTNLGADSGIGISTALYILKNAESHGPLRVIFTANGESTMSGAQGINPKYLEGDYLINLNWENNDSIGVGSPGSYVYEIHRQLNWVKPSNTIPYIIHIEGLKGGPSFSSENKENANAIKTLGETLAQIKGAGVLFELASFNGGESEGTIPTQATALILINDSDVKNLKKVFNNSYDSFSDAYNNVEEDFIFTCSQADMPDKVLSAEDESSIVSFLYSILNGVQSMSKDYEGRIESMTNLGVISTSTGDFISKLQVDSISKEKIEEIFYAHEEISRMCDIGNGFTEAVPMWFMDPSSPLIERISDSYKNTLDKKTSLQVMDVSNECGWFLKINPDLQIVSIGPSIHNANSPDESLNMATVVEPVNVLLDFLENSNKI